MSRSVRLNGHLDLGKAYYKIYFATLLLQLLKGQPQAFRCILIIFLGGWQSVNATI
jgi:hypothetical protein